MTEILVPTGVITPFGVIPLPMARKVQGAARGHREVSDLAHRMGGRGAKPTKPILVYGADEQVLTVIMTDGETEAAELEDLAHATLERQDERIKKVGRAFNFDEAREKAGWIRRENWGAAAAEAIRERARRHQANPVTDPARQPQYYTKEELARIRDECDRLFS